MENASKALMIAGGILIAMLVLSIGVYLFANYRDVSYSYEKNMSTTEIQKLNSNFTKFDKRDNITIQEIVTIANFARQYEEKTGIHIKVLLPGIAGDLNDDIDTIELIRENSSDNETKMYFTCTAIKYENGRVNVIIFRETY